MMPGNFPSFHNMTQAESLAWMMAPNPEIRLTLTQGTPVTTSDVTGATSVFVEPMGGGIVPLFQDTAGIYPCIRKLAPSTLSQALGTLASATIPNDLFLFDNNGSVGVEKLAWTSGTARATAVDLVGGRLYKNANYTRLLAGTFYPTSTTTTADSFVNRFLFNMYNRVSRAARITSNNTHTYNSVTERNWNNSATDTACNCMIGIVDQVIMMNGYGRGGDLSAGVSPVNNIIAIRLNSTTYSDTQGQVFFFTSASGSKIIGSTPQIAVDVPILGLNTLIMREIDGSTGGSGSTFTSATTMMNFMA